MALACYAQVRLPGTWKFKTGDDPEWSSPSFNDGSWKTIEAGKRWEDQGFPDYDGYAWYRTTVRIPSSLKTGAFPGSELKISLGKIDDGDQVYLNGKIIGQNAGVVGTIEEGNHTRERIYTLPVDDPAIRWDAENVLAVRVYDRSGSGGMYEGPYTISMMGISDAVTFNTTGEMFSFPARTTLKKTVYLQSSIGDYHFSGTMSVKVTDPLTGKQVYTTSAPASFAMGRDFAFTYKFSAPKQQSYRAEYTFRDARSGKQASSFEETPYILTPAVSEKPSINGARVVGVRPGHPFQFRIPVTGVRPVRYQVSGLPSDLQLDPATGIITGTIPKEGTYEVDIKVTNQKGSDERKLSIRVGDLIGLTPAMGWNSWNVWGTSVNEQKVKDAADAMVEKGLVNHGWTYINIDDGWESPERAADGQVVTNDKFPDMKRLADYVHHDGLKLGIYSSPGTLTCGGYMGSYQHEAQDAKTYAGWGIDYLKYDWCSYRRIAPAHPDLAWEQKPYRLMDSALHQISRDIYFSLCQYGMGDVWKWGAEVGGNSWRTTGDIRDNWGSMSKIGFNQGAAAPYSAPGHWNDPDMLVVGLVGWGPRVHASGLTPDEQYTHISLWSMLAAPLLIGCDMRSLDPFTLNLLTNDEVLAVDQDPLGKAAMQVASSDSVLVYERTLVDGSRAVGVFNIGSKPASMQLSMQVLGLTGRQKVRDLWRQKDMGAVTGSYQVKDIPTHGVYLYKITPAP
jgi:hypothetical protein